MKESEFVGGKLKIKRLKIKNKSQKKKKKGREREGWDEQEKMQSNIVELVREDKRKFDAYLNSQNEQNNSNVPCDSEQRIDFKETESEELKNILNSNLTEAEKANKLILQKREKQKIEKILKESYRERLQKFNDNLASLSEHFDIPKIGPG